MGREIRRVPPNWEHPRYTKDDAADRRKIGELRPVFDQDYQTASEEWMANFALWQEGKHPAQPCEYCRYFWEYDSPPDEEYHRTQKWSMDDATHYQMYETVTEGTPITPIFATKEDLVQHLMHHGDDWDVRRGNDGWSEQAARSFVDTGFAPSSNGFPKR